MAQYIGGVARNLDISEVVNNNLRDDDSEAVIYGKGVGAVLTWVFYSDEIIKAANVALAPTIIEQLKVQLEGVLATMVYSAVVTFIILKVIDLVS